MKYIAFITALLLSLSAHADSTPQALWESGNADYAAGDYHGAADHYDSIVNKGEHSYKLYYNLGNAYFKSNRIGKAMLNYNRAMKLRPTDSDIQYNHAIASRYVKDKIEAVPEFFLLTIIRNLRLSLSSDAWAALSLLALLLGFGATMFYLLSSKIALRKMGFFASLVMACGFFLCSAFASTGRSEMIDSTGAIVMRTAAPVKSAPNATGKDIFVLHEGTRVEVTGSLDNWYEVEIADGNKGWIEKNSVEII